MRSVSPALAGMASSLILGAGFAFVTAFSFGAEWAAQSATVPSPLLFVAISVVEVVAPLAVLGALFGFIIDRLIIQNLILRTMVVWAFFFPIFRIVRDQLALAKTNLLTPGPPHTLQSLFDYYQSTEGFLLFLAMQAFFGAGFGAAFFLAYQKVLRRMMRNASR